MKFRIELITDGEEEVVARVKAPSEFTEKLRECVEESSDREGIVVYREGEMREVPYLSVECFATEKRWLVAILNDGEVYRVKGTLSGLLPTLPDFFVRINKSAIANLRAIKKFKSSFGGAIDAVFESGYEEYVSRRCLAEIKRRYLK